MEIKESTITDDAIELMALGLIRPSLVKNLSKALTDEQFGQTIRLVLRRSLLAEITDKLEFMEEKKVDESEFFSHEDSIIALTAQLLWSDVKLSRLEPID